MKRSPGEIAIGLTAELMPPIPNCGELLAHVVRRFTFRVRASMISKTRSPFVWSSDGSSVAV